MHMYVGSKQATVANGKTKTPPQRSFFMKDSADNGGTVRAFLCLLCALKHYCIKQRHYFPIRSAVTLQPEMHCHRPGIHHAADHSRVCPEAVTG